MDLKRIEDLVIISLQEVQEELDEQNTGPFSSDTEIFGRHGLLDSMGMVSLITDLEQKIEDEFDVSLILADERAMSEKKSPFRSVSLLAQYIYTLIIEEKQNEGA